jgi:hypothetical protein
MISALAHPFRTVYRPSDIHGNKSLAFINILALLSPSPAIFLSTSPQSLQQCFSKNIFSERFLQDDGSLCKTDACGTYGFHRFSV